MPTAKNSSLHKLLLIILFLSVQINLFSQVNHEDSINYFQHVEWNNSFELKIKGETPTDFILKNKNGSKFTNDSLDSKITFVDFWFKSCLPCFAEFEALEKLYIKNKPNKDFQFISITFDPDSVIERMRKEHSLTYPIYHLSQDSCNKLHFNTGYPTCWIVNKNREIVYYSFGGSTDPLEADKFLNYFIQAELDKLLK